jgi:hypothetical protein
MPHTPGPWESRISALAEVVYCKDSNGCDRRVCEMIGQDSHANAKLIARAPDMLAALREIVSQIDQGGSSGKALGRDACIQRARQIAEELS